MEGENASEPYFRYGERGSQPSAQNVPCRDELFLSQADFLKLLNLPLFAYNGFSSAFTLANVFLEELSLLGFCQYARLSHLTRKASQDVLERFFRIFSCNLNHIATILPEVNRFDKSAINDMALRCQQSQVHF